MAAAGQFTPMPNCAIFADTGWEPKEVYAHLDKLEAALPFPVHRVSAGNIRADVLAALNSSAVGRFGQPPFYVIQRNGDGTDAGGTLWRKCTTEYKIQPIQRKIRELLGAKKGQQIRDKRARQWFGISTDEAHRQKDSRVPWSDNWYPLIDHGLSRNDCLHWLSDHGFGRPRKSACIGCPYHSNHVWARMKRDYPEEWADAVEFDALLRANGNRIPGTVGESYLHRRMLPLPEAILKEDRPDQGEFEFMGEECEGMCGV